VVQPNQSSTVSGSTSGPPIYNGGNLPSTVNPANYPFNFTQGAYSVYYKLINNDTIEVGVVLQGVGWVAFGPSATGGMLMSDIVFAYYDANGPHAEDRFITSRSPGCPGVCLDTDLGGTNDVLVFNGSQANGVTQLLWRKLLVTGDTIADVNFVLGTNMAVAYGWNPTYPGPTVTQHLVNTKGILSIQLPSPTSPGSSSLSPTQAPSSSSPNTQGSSSSPNTKGSSSSSPNTQGSSSLSPNTKGSSSPYISTSSRHAIAGWAMLHAISFGYIIHMFM